MDRDRVISSLRRKLGLLVECDHYAGLEEIALALGTKLKTLESWADSGTDKSTPGLISNKHYAKVVDLFAHAIAQHHSVGDVEPLLKGTPRDLAPWLQPSGALSFVQIIERDGIVDRCHLFVEQIQPQSAVARKSARRRATNHHVKTDQWFRIVFEGLRTSPYALGIQNHREHWLFASVERDVKNLEILMPGFDQDRLPDWMQEQEFLEDNRFIAIQIDAPWPLQVVHAIDNNTAIDAGLLQTIAEFYESRPVGKRAIFVMDINVQP